MPVDLTTLAKLEGELDPRFTHAQIPMEDLRILCLALRESMKEADELRKALAPIQDAARRVRIIPDLASFVDEDADELRVDLDVPPEVMADLIRAALGTIGRPTVDASGGA